MQIDANTKANHNDCQIVENLATIGYDPTSSYTAAYDWRLSYINLEKRGMVYIYIDQISDRTWRELTSY